MMASKLRARVFLASKALVTALFVVIVLYSVPLAEVARLFARLNWWYVALLLLLNYGMIVLSCWKWRILLRRKGIATSLHSLVRLYILGNFFNNFLPSMIGGDSARGLILGRKSGRMTDVFLSIFMERFTGFVALVSLTSLAVVIDHPFIHIGNLKTICLAALAGTGLLVFLAFSRRGFALVARLFFTIVPGGGRFREKLIGLHQSLQEFRHQLPEFAGIMLLSVLFHVITGLNLYLSCLALNYQPDFIEMLIVTPFILLLAVLPITINGIGLWEGSFVLFFSLLGIPKPLALSVALLLRLKTLLISSLGGLFYLQERGENQTLGGQKQDEGQESKR
ncbi:MAG: flippase-like domain-containing protein [Desulfobulbaceae bacterium]|jgi:uncharacterized protein (TIRG00374 family)|nr:flippase-like domain-containing protein [Desulfobulbaceae bacterium]